MIRPKRVPIREQSPRDRIRNFDEVVLGYTREEAVREAERCLQCQSPTCVEGCPVQIDIPRFVRQISQQRFDDAVRTIYEQNQLPAICGRVCPQESQCEGACALAQRFEAVAIGKLERFCADWSADHGPSELVIEAPLSVETRVAVVGSGPAGLTAAAELRRRGHRVTVFELLHEPGGVLIYGIPEFRLPKAIVRREIESLRASGVEFLVNQVIGRTLSVHDLLEAGFDAVFLGTGAGLPHFLGIPGEQLNGVFSANELLTRTNLMRGYRFPEVDTPLRVGEYVAVIGGGNVAMDAARTALRLGAERSTIVYRRSVNELPARAEEVEHAQEEGVRFELLAMPVRFIDAQGDGSVTGIECIEMELKDKDGTGRPRPVPLPGTEFTIQADTVIVATGNGPHPLVPQTTPELAVDRRGNIIAEPATGVTSMPHVFAGGDIVTGAATVIEAMGAGKAAAAAIDQHVCSTRSGTDPVLASSE